MTIVRAPIAAILTCALGALMLSACGDDDTDGDGNYSNAVVRERDGIRLTIAADTDSYDVGDTVRLRAEVENISTADLLYGAEARPSNDPAVQVFVITELTGRQALPPLEPALGTGGTLAPMERIAVEVEWDQALDMYQDPQQAPEGRYSATALVYVKAPDATAPAELSAAVEFELVGGEAIATPDQIIATSIAQEEVKAWFEGRGTSLACAHGDLGLFYNADVSTGNVAETFDFVYNAQVLNGLPYCSTVTEGDTWRIIFSHDTGAEPTRVSAFFEVHTGEFIRLEEGGPVPSNSGR